MPEALTAGQRDELLAVARAVARKAYAPYSKFRVGAVVLGERGVYTGTNVENASFGLTLCAERSALAAAVAAEDLRVRAVAVACIDASEHGAPGTFMPCGACRQWLAELAPDAVLLIAGTARDYTVGELLPFSFALE